MQLKKYVKYLVSKLQSHNRINLSAKDTQYWIETGGAKVILNAIKHKSVTDTDNSIIAVKLEYPANDSLTRYRTMDAANKDNYSKLNKINWMFYGLFVDIAAMHTVQFLLDNAGSKNPKLSAFGIKIKPEETKDGECTTLRIYLS